MNPSDPSLFGGIVHALSTGLPHLLMQFAVAVALLAAGVAIYMAATPFRERELIEEGNTAAGVVMSGAILAMASNPTFKPSTFVGRVDPKKLSALYNDPRNPLFNRAIAGLYPPGSTWKPVSTKLP